MLPKGRNKWSSCGTLKNLLLLGVFSITVLCSLSDQRFGTDLAMTHIAPLLFSSHSYVFSGGQRCDEVSNRKNDTFEPLQLGYWWRK